MFGGIPDLSKIQPMMEQALAAFKQLQEDVAFVKQQQEELLELLKADVSNVEEEGK